MIFQRARQPKEDAMDFASANLTAGQLNAIVKKLGGEAGVQRLLCGEATVVETPPREISTWKTVRLGVHKTADEYRKALQAGKHRSGEWVTELLGKPVCHCASEE